MKTLLGKELKGLNPYSNGTMYLIVNNNYPRTDMAKSLNPYSNGTMYLIYIPLANDATVGVVLILILMEQCI